ncbi:MFS transporter [Enterococcus sp. BWB1-3]|uniref:MFS transporter n=1 Tax=unclassified Enterococcus TaxID=2608891 RepID=UPI001923ACAB|nr:MULTISPECIES: MFS transporter [unclassified Enterococcus]MBL1229280.1 MFS transporter [Enterococcus sp. BWB1-3]MCB5951770.1 MFS transporter [Enterococcus sp. BWT-B8]MCB5953937.1 MFS transporter [Enterococcus sp. CWB-B31]
MEIEQHAVWSKNFAYIITGQTLSVLANSVMKFALSLYILDLTKSAALYGTLLAVSIIPTIIFSPIGGVLADNFNKKNMMVLMDGLYASIAALIYFAVASGANITIIAVCLLLMSVVSAFETPIVQSSMPLLFKQENLLKANSVVNQIQLFANFVGPILAGFLYSLIKIEWIFIICLFLFLGAAFIELFIKIPILAVKFENGAIATVIKDLKESWLFIRKEEPAIVKIILVLGSISFFISGLLFVGIPYIIHIILGLDSQYLGINQGLISLAGIMGAVMVGVLSTKLNMKNSYLIVSLSSLLVILIGLIFMIDMPATATFGLFTFVIMLLQALFTLFSIFIVSNIQASTPVQLVGKVMSYVTTLSLCAQPLSQAVYGILFDIFANSVYILFIITGLIMLLVSYFSKSVFKNLT